MSDELKDAVRAASDIVQVIGEYVRLTRQGSKYKALCPFHDDHRPSMDVDPKFQNFTCWACGKRGDVFTFVMEKERVDFREALELLAKRANITLKRGKPSPEDQARPRMYELMQWAGNEYHRFLLESSGAAAARAYVAERKLSAETIKKYGLGFAPNAWEFLATNAQKQNWPADLLVTLGLCGRRDSDGTLYDRFRDRVIFPIRDVRGRTVGLGGRILPQSSSSADAPKYYNSSDTPLFTKSEHLYGLDVARDAGEKAGWLAVVEGYTDVLMAHQMGVLPVVATLGTALNERHIQQLRKFVSRVVLLFDADAGGEAGVDRALALFVSQNVELAIATLPEDRDPCEFLLEEGAEAFEGILARAVDALEFKLAQVLTPAALASIEGRHRALDSVLRVLALAPEPRGQGDPIRQGMIVQRVAHRLGLKQELVWQRLVELKRQQRGSARPTEVAAPEKEAAEPTGSEARSKPAHATERALLEILVAEPSLVARAMETLTAEEIEHPGVRRVLEQMYALHTAGRTPDLDELRLRLADNTALASFLVKLQGAGLEKPNRAAALEEVMVAIRQRRQQQQVDELRGKLQNLPTDAPPPVDILRKIQEERRKEQEKD